MIEEPSERSKQKPEEQKPEGGISEEVNHHRFEAKAYLLLFIWIFADVLVVFERTHLAVWFFGCALFLALALFTYHFQKGWPKYKRLAWWLHVATAPSVVIILFLITKLTPTPATDESGNPIGLLVPANDPMPERLANHRELLRDIPEWAKKQVHAEENWPKDPYFILLGNSTFVIENNFVMMPIVVFHGTNVLTIIKTPNGMAVSADFFDATPNRNLVARIETNNFTLNRLNFLSRGPPNDKSGLVVTDQRGIKLLDIRFSRTNVFKILGRFRFPDGTEATATTNDLEYLGNHIGGQIQVGSGIAITDNGGIGFF